jgi:DNA-binding beta-propeller fold protein YncE
MSQAMPLASSRKCILAMLAMCLARSPLAADVIIDTVQINRNIAPSVMINPVANKLYMTDPSDSAIMILDGYTNQVKRVKLGMRLGPMAMNHVTNRVFIAYRDTGYARGKLFILDGTADTLVGTVTIGCYPVDIAVNPVTNQIYVANASGTTPYDTATVTVVDGNSLQIKEVPIGRDPWRIAVNTVKNVFYVSNYDPGVSTAYAVNGSTLKKFPFVLPQGSNDVAINPATQKVFISTDAGIAVIDAATNTYSFMSSEGLGPTLLAVNPALNKLYMCTDRSISSYDFANKRYASHFKSTRWNGVIANPLTNKAYFSGPVTNIIDGKRSDSSLVTWQYRTYGFAVNPLTNKVYLPFAHDNIADLLVVDGSSNDLIEAKPYGLPGQMLDYPGTNMVYGTYTSSSLILGINIVTGDTQRIALSKRFYSCAANPAKNTLYACADNAVDEIDLAARKTAATIPTPSRMWYPGVNLATGRLYGILHPRADSSCLVEEDFRTLTSRSVGVKGTLAGLVVDCFSNRVYSLWKGDTLFIVDADDFSTRILPLHGPVHDLAVNPVNKTVECINSLDDAVIAIHVKTNEIDSIAVPGLAAAFCIDCETGKTYVASSFGYLSVIDTSGAVDYAVSIPGAPDLMTVNHVTGKVYTSHNDPVGDTVSLSVLDLQTRSVTRLRYPQVQAFLHADPVNDMLYGVSRKGVFTRMSPSPAFDTRLRARLVSSGALGTEPRPPLSGSFVDSLTGFYSVADRVLYRKASWAKPWSVADVGGPGHTWSWNWNNGDSLAFGENFLQTAPLNAQSGTINMCGRGSFFTGNPLVSVVYRTRDIPLRAAGSSIPQSKSYAISVRHHSVVFQVTRTGPARAELLNMKGQRVVLFFDDIKAPGTYTVPIQSIDVSTGAYIIRLAQGHSITTRMFCMAP